jgi:DNA-binding response OmpR family regulator
LSLLTVLLVDDDADSAGEMAELLELSGYRALVATNLAEARAMLGERPDCALVDIRLGEESGLTLAQEWQDGKGPEVMLLSGAELTGAQAALFATAPPLLLKPADLNCLTAFLETVRSIKSGG